MDDNERHADPMAPPAAKLIDPLAGVRRGWTAYRATRPCMPPQPQTGR
jgi:hypothetical protein